MKKHFFLLLFCFIAFIANAQVVLIQENFQDWKAEQGIAPEPPSKSPTGVAYSITKKLFDGKTDGTFSSNALIVSPAQSTGAAGEAAGNGSPSKGRIVIKGTKSYLELPKLSSIGQVVIKASAGTDLKEFKLQVLNGVVYEDIPNSVTPCEKAVIKAFTFNLAYSVPTTLRIVPNSSSSINIWDIQVMSNASSTKK
ncbi:MAG: hypothetical protein ACOYOT_07020 [Bacteroidales bacterium]